MTGFLTLENPILPLTLENPILFFGRSFITSKSLFKCFLSTGFRNMCIALGTVFLVSFNVGLTVDGLMDCFDVDSVSDSIKGSVRSASTIPVFKPEIQLLLATKNLFLNIFHRSRKMCHLLSSKNNHYHVQKYNIKKKKKIFFKSREITFLATKILFLFQRPLQ